MNKVITIPKGKFVLVPHEEFEAFSKWKKAVKVRLDEQWFWTPEWQKKEAEADAAVRDSKVRGPFSDYKKLISALKRKKK